VNARGKHRGTLKVSGKNKGVVGEVTGFLGILNNIDNLGEAKRDNKKGKRIDKKKRSCSSDHKSKASCKNIKKRPSGRKVSVSICSDNSHSDHKSDHKRRRGGSSDSEDCSDTRSESHCSKKSGGKRRRLAECVGKKNSPKILA
jgi:hypothetical protein